MPSYVDSAQNIETVIFQLAAIATNATSAVTIDTTGKGAFAIVDVCHSKATNGSSNAKWNTLKLQHGTTTHPTNHTNFTAGVGTTESTATSSQFVLGTHNDTVNMSITRFFVDLRTTEKILRIEATAAPSHHTVVSIIHYFRKPQSANTAAKRGCAASTVVS